ncbi:Homocysteine S-methyltransferase 2 [Wickerhamomyces ciferrii]|uniref:Homocysteine S-methyltransferase 2 n=1 Tax=Wickerhamomyces ciferrii (strain ATCC 14091 / BCRC 22168 / CBS 111 / JCM 3599 / NBRC 0793 / NRRL Y-1031 F-60-10) TaxID=1206466 RepID=K0KNI8_WICCF|nr:Homocysteine S-methyltransferase 2 [Wickerhamomyces ciferrii]CCH42688.1 Homocysteine S-methyltransferase 2 [Wickerhamomyces ciferrii]
MSLKSRLSSKVPIVLDGALGTLLPEEAQSHSLWSTHTVITSPSIIQNIHQQYIENGAQLIQTSTYQSSDHPSLQTEFNIDYEQVLLKSIDLADQARGDRKDVWIVGSIGPYGASLANGAEYTGDYGDIKSSNLVEFHKERLEMLCKDNRVDLIGLETMPNINEIKILIELMQGYDKDYYLSLSINGDTLADGTKVESLKELVDGNPKLLAIGVNCLPLKESLTWLNELQILGKDLIVYPNSGEVYDAVNKKWNNHPNGTLTWNEYVQELQKLKNVKIIGGCCRTTPNDIKQIFEAIKRNYE